MGANLVKLNVNPCKMCMPMGAVSALSGIKGCMSILHGSQGCATYIRRHMATHYNEPVDIASSSLTEEGTVFGGEENLLKGLKNLISLYNPEVIGVATTCLAETIGEDVPRIIDKFYEQNPEQKVKIINVSSAGYGGTQYEGFFAALRAAVEQLTEDCDKGNYINVVTPMISPADTRWIKDFLNKAGIEYILLPDLSENLDGVSVSVYERLKTSGTSVEDISKMGGAKLTIEMSDYISDEVSPAKFLSDKYGVPYVRIQLPVGIAAMDKFTEVITEAGGSISEEVIKERGRYLDAMVDAHKYCAEARVCVFGEPDFVKSVVSLCCENGAVPVVAVTGSVCTYFRESLENQIKECADRYFIDEYIIEDDVDFDQIEEYCLKYGVTLMIGSSEGRRISGKHGIPLIRCAFPIHDHVGGQRVRTIGFDGSLFLIDAIANSAIDHTHSTYRTEIAEKYLDKDGKEDNKEKTAVEINAEEIAKKTASHPCYSCSGCGTYARMHIPVAPKCNIQCNYCVRKFDCPNESRPGVTTEVLSSEAAFEKYKKVKAEYPNLTVVGIAGPGDALANFEEVKKSLELIREYDPDVTFCLSTNGLMLPLYAEELIKLGVTHITVTMNAINPEIAAKIYHHVDYMGQRFEGIEAASVLIANQLTGIKLLASRGIMVKVNCVAIKGINDGHLFEVTKKAKELGAFMTNIMPHIPVVGSAFEGLDRLNNKEIEHLRKECEVNIKQMRHCQQCRADAIGTLAEDNSIRFRKGSEKAVKADLVKKYRVAVATKSGMLVDIHFGHAKEFYIYDTDGKESVFIEKRSVEKYCAGKEDCDDHDDKMEKILYAVGDCEYVIALRIGETPRRRLAEKGVTVISTYDTVENAVISAIK